MTTPAQRWAWRIATLIAIAGVIGVLVLGRYQYVFGLVTGSPDADRPEPCLPGRAVAVLDSPHVSRAAADEIEYNSVPATSGPHFPYTVAPGYYGTPVEAPLFVHAMEHGHVIVHYAEDTSARDVARLTDLARSHIDEVVLTPSADVRDGFALTSWGRIDTFGEYDEQRIARFIEAMSGRYNHGWAKPAACPAESSVGAESE